MKLAFELARIALGLIAITALCCFVFFGVFYLLSAAAVAW